jgi:SDR family mycofactocin-dependent oxidoreductase
MGMLDGRVALITGGARGQGRSHAITLAQHGADVAVCDICEDIPTNPYPLGTETELNETVEMVEDLGQEALGIKADVRYGDQMKKVAEETYAKFGKIDILLANAGICSFSKVVEMTDEMWDDMINTNLKGVFNAMRAVVPYMVEQKYGRIVATASSAAQTGFGNIGHYVAAKWGVMGLVKSLVHEVSEYGITVNGVIPTEVKTMLFMNETTFGYWRPDLENPTLEDMAPIAHKFNAIPITAVEAQDISNAILFLVSDQARYITGHFINVDAGRCAMVMAGGT